MFDVISGRKPILYGSICIFLVSWFLKSGRKLSVFQLGSALCGAAQSMTWLIVARAIQGIGGGGVLQLVIITISDIVPLKE